MAQNLPFLCEQNPRRVKRKSTRHTVTAIRYLVPNKNTTISPNTHYGNCYQYCVLIPNTRYRYQYLTDVTVLIPGLSTQLVPVEFVQL